MAATVKMPGRTSHYTALTLNNWKYLGTDDRLVDANQGSDVARAFRLACGLPPWTAPNPSAGGGRPSTRRLTAVGCSRRFSLEPRTYPGPAGRWSSRYRTISILTCTAVPSPSDNPWFRFGYVM